MIVHTIWWRVLIDKRTMTRKTEKERKSGISKNEKKKTKHRCNADTDETADKKKENFKKKTI